MQWFVENIEHPFPTKKKKLELCEATGLSIQQVDKWMCNEREKLKKFEYLMS